ncbi:MAG: hypothetical protein P8P83_05125 [Rickettsiaceae bacterium]|nr:hypothetical protein [Rickettsiaceae bacterium]
MEQNLWAKPLALVIALQNIITQYINQTKDKPIDGIELYATILGEVKKNNSLKQCIQDRKLGITEIIQSYLVTRRDNEDYIQKSWEEMRGSPEDSKVNFLKKYVDDLQDDQELDVYIKEHRTLPSFEKDKLGSYGLDVESLNILLDDFGPVLLQQLDETSNLLSAINAGESTKDALSRFKLDDFKLPIQNNAPAVVNIFQSYLASRKGEEEALQKSWEEMRDATANSKIKFLKESVELQDDQEIDVYIQEHRTLPSFEKDKLGSYGLDVESTNKLLGDFGPILLENIDEISGMFNVIKNNKISDAFTMFFKLLDENPNLLQAMKDNSHITNKIVDSTLGNSASSRILKNFLADPNQMHAKSLIQNVVLPTVKASSQVYDYTTKIKNMIIYMVDLVVRSFKPLFNSKKTAPERAPNKDLAPTKELASNSHRPQAKGSSLSQQSSACEKLESDRAKKGSQTKVKSR